MSFEFQTGRSCNVNSYFRFLAPTARGQDPYTCTQADVDAEKEYCTTCLQGAVCVTADQPPTEVSPCTSGKVIKQGALCVTADEPQHKYPLYIW